MDSPLWTTKHTPSLDDLPQDDLRNYLKNISNNSVNLMLYGPRGVGKTAAVRALATELHDNPDADLIEINVADFFDRTKKEIANDERFSSFIDSKKRRNSSKTDLINHVLKESASYQPVSGEFKTVLLDNAEDMRKDFQQALRRVMEQYHDSTQFIIATRQPAALIPPIKSRCFPHPVRSPDNESLTTVLTQIADAEDVDYDEDGLEYICGAADGDIREAVLMLQTTFEQEGEVTMDTVFEAVRDVGVEEDVKEMLDEAEYGEFTDARSKLDELLADEGYTATDILDAILDVAETRYRGDDHARVVQLAGDVEFDLVEGANERVHLSNFLATLPEVTG